MGTETQPHTHTDCAGYSGNLISYLKHVWRKAFSWSTKTKTSEIMHFFIGNFMKKGRNILLCRVLIQNLTNSDNLIFNTAFHKLPICAFKLSEFLK